MKCVSGRLRIAECRNLKSHSLQNTRHRTQCTTNDPNNTGISSEICNNETVFRRRTEKMIISEGNDPPPFGLITPDALSPCLFTLVQQLGNEGVNKASSPSTVWINTRDR